LITKNSRSVNRFTRITRSNLKHLIDWGHLNGFRKDSW
jgi:ribosomal protein S14